jgi:hypothetical protein
MGKLFAALLVAAPLLAFAVWSYLHQTQLTETRIDQRETQFRLDWDRFDQRFGQLRGWEPDPELAERIERNKAKLEAIEARKAAAQVRLDSAVEAVDAELKAYDQSR